VLVSGSTPVLIKLGRVHLGPREDKPEPIALERRPAAVESAVEGALESGLRTPDLGGEAGTVDATRAVLEHL
jgi:hypothetical protein